MGGTTKSVALKKDGNYSINSPQQMSEMATLLKTHIVQNKLYTNIKGRNYAHVEGWQFAGGLMGIFPIIKSVTDISKGAEIRWQAEVEIVNIVTDKVVGRGFAICSSKESNKKSFDEYAILSMAQTRAIGKAYRNLIGWVMKLAGYEATPKEEMTKVGEQSVETVVVGKEAPQVEAECHGCANPMTKAEVGYSLKLYKKQLCRVCQKTAKRK